MITALRRSGFVLCLCLLCAMPAAGQQTVSTAEPEPAAAEAVEPEPAKPVPIPASEISDRAADTKSRLREISTDLAEAEELQAIADEYAAEKTRLESLRQDSVERLRGSGPPSVLIDTQKEWLRADARLDGWSRDLTSQADAISALMDPLEDDRKTWQATRDDPTATELPEELKQTIREVLESIDEVERGLRSARDDILSLQARISEEGVGVEGILAQQRDEISRRRQALVRIDSPPLWSMSVVREANVAEEIEATWRAADSAVGDYLEEAGPRLLKQLAVFALLAAALLALRARSRTRAGEDRSLESASILLDRPIATALVVFVLFTYLATPNAPSAWIGLLGLTLLAAGLRLAPRMTNTPVSTWAYPPAFILFFWFLTTVTPAGGPLSRALLLLLCLFGVLACVYFGRWEGPATVAGSSRLLAVVETGNRFATGLFALGALANVVGSVGLATFVTSGTLRATTAALVLWLMAVVLQGLVAIALGTGAARGLGLVGWRAETVRTKLFRLIRWLAVVAWVYLTLRGFLVLESLLSYFADGLGAEVSIGRFSIAPMDVLIFFVVVWLSYKLSQLIRFVLDTSVFDHVDLPRGAPAAISTLTHYTVMVAGLLAAFAAAGFDLSRVTIMFGALGVGIGFGLQNIVNNFVSGLILLFERPIKVGDAIELDSLQGEVKDIAIRASIVRTYDGAEIIVPNSDLISNRVINWTYHNDRTRIRLPVRVAHGTESSSVSELLERVASDHPEVIETPPPAALLLGLGERSLDFELRFWTSWGASVRVSSEVRVRATEALTKAGIEIPVPRQEIQLQSSADQGSPGKGVTPWPRKGSRS